MTRRLLTLNGLAALCVVFYHATAWVYTAMFWWTDRYQNVRVPNFDQMGNFSYYGLRSIEQLVSFAIPTFIFVSGYFIAFATQRDQKTIEWSVILNRVKNLVIPFLLWSLLILIIRWFEGIRYMPDEYLAIILLGRAADPYYYIPLLVQLYLIAPLLVPIARKHPRQLSLITGIIQLIMLVVNYPRILNITLPLFDSIPVLNWSGFFLTHIFWFCFGMVVGFHLKTFKDALDRIKRFLPGATLVLFLLGIVEWEILLRLSGQAWIGPKQTLVDQLYAGLFMFSFWVHYPFPASWTSHLSDLGSKSFGIYLIHTPVVEYTARLVYHVVPALLAFHMGFLAILVAMSLGIPLLIIAAVNRSPIRLAHKYIVG